MSRTPPIETWFGRRVRLRHPRKMSDGYWFRADEPLLVTGVFPAADALTLTSYRPPHRSLAGVLPRDVAAWEPEEPKP